MSELIPGAVRDLIALDHSVAHYRVESLTPRTRAFYADVWQSFVNFCSPRDAWRATPLDVARWLVCLVEWDISPATIRARLVALNCYFERFGKGYLQGHPGVGTRPSPGRELLVKQTLRGIVRKHSRPRDRKLPLLLDSLEKMIDHQPDSLLGIRNKALLVIGWGAALRGQELQMLDLLPSGDGYGWVELRDDGLIVTLRRSKTNSGERGFEDYGIPARPTAPRYCPVRLARAWLAAGGHTDGPFFRGIGSSADVRPTRLLRESVSHVIKASAAAIGLDPKTVATQSLRAGCVTWLALEGVSLFRIQKHSGHRTIGTLMVYIRPPRDPQNSPLAETRWIR